MLTEAFLKRVLVFIGVILSGLITLIFISTPESLQVPVPDQVPSITTKSSLNREFDEAKQFFGSSIAAAVPGAAVASVVSWSPNSKYILVNLRFTTEAGSRTVPYVLDLPAKSYIPIPNANWIDTVSWSGSFMTYPAETGYAIFDLDKKTGRTFGSTVGGGQPILSGDASYVAYTENGLMLYSLKTEKSIRLTSDVRDIPALWKADNKSLIIFTAGKDQNSATLTEMQIGTRVITNLTALPQLPKASEWVIKDQLAKITLGQDDGFFDYSFDLTDNSLKLLAETSEGIAFASVGAKSIATFKGNKISLYDSHAMKISETKRSAKGRVANFNLLSPTSALIISEKDEGYDLSIFNLISGAEISIDSLWVPYVIVAPSGRGIVTVPEGNGSVQFTELPPLS